VVLGRLLQDPRMIRAWPQIERQRKKVAGSLLHFTYSSFWGATQTALFRANRAEKDRKAGKPPLRQRSRKQAKDAAKMASRLVAHVTKDGPLDFLASDLFPFSNEVVNLAWKGIRDRDLNKAGVSLANTTFGELLRAFVARARADAAPPTVLRVRANVRLLTFCRELYHIFFKRRFEPPMFSIIATIANVALEIPEHKQVTGEDVRKMRLENRK
jgi:hypothetical protein